MVIFHQRSRIMNTLASLIETIDPVTPTVACGAVLDRFLDAPGCDLLPVVHAGQTIGVIARGGVRIDDVGRPAREVMTAAIAVDPDMTVDDARALWLSYADPLAGLVATKNGVYCGIVSARALMGR